MKSKNKFRKYFSLHDDYFKYLFLAFFGLQFTFLSESVLFFILKRPLPSIVRPICSLISFLLFFIFITLYMKKTSPTDKETNFKGSVSTIFAVIGNIILLSFIYIVYAQMLIQMLHFAPYLMSQNKLISVGILALYVIIGIVVNIIAFESIILFTSIYDLQLSIFQIGRAFTFISLKSLKKLCSVFLNTATIYLLIVFIVVAQHFFEVFSVYLIPYAFLQIFLTHITASILCAFTACITIRMSREMLIQYFSSDILERLYRPSSIKIPLFPIILVVLSSLMIIQMNVVKFNFIDNYITQIKGEIKLGDYFQVTGLSIKSINNYDSAYSKLLALNGYLKGIDGLKNKRKETIDVSTQAFKSSSELDPKNVYVPYFKANLGLIEDSKNFKLSEIGYINASQYPYVVPEVYFGLLKTYRLEHNNAMINETMNSLIGSKVFYDRFATIETWSQNKLDKYINSLKEIENILGPKMLYKAVEKTKLLDYSGAINDLNNLKKLYPKEALIDFYIAQAYNSFKNEQSNYASVKTFTTSFVNEYDTSASPELDLNKKLFKIKMDIDINDVSSAEKTLQDLYSNSPNNNDIAELYAYVLTMNKKDDAALKILDNLLSRNKNLYFSSFISSICYLNKKDYKNSLLSIENMIKITENDVTLSAELDKYLYSYTLAYSASTVDKMAIAELENVKDNILLYNYIYGMKSWRDHDSKKSLGYLDEVLRLNNNLGYAYYVTGVNYFEDTVINKGTDFSQAEMFYLKSLEFVPNHVEGYFALAHCYKDWGKNKEALRAFRKVVDLQPYQDHRIDPYGITVHSIGQINELQKYDEKEIN